MANHNSARSRSRSDPTTLRFPQELRGWLIQHDEMLRGLHALRRLGADEAVAAIEALQEVRKVRLSWELWEMLLDGEGIDADALLLEHIELGDVLLARAALWGLAWETPPVRGVSP